MNGRQLREWRQRRGLSQTDLAGYLGVTASCISQYERGRVRIPESLELRLERIAPSGVRKRRAGRPTKIEAMVLRGPVQRCPRCGRRVVIPCRACLVEGLPRQRTFGQREGREEDLAPDLPAEAEARLRALRARKVMEAESTMELGGQFNGRAPKEGNEG